MLFGAQFPLGSALLGTAPLTWNMQLTCWILGFTALPVNVVLKKIPLAPFQKFAALIDLESPGKEDMVGKGVGAL